MGLYPVLVGLLFICGLCFSEVCVKELLEDVDFPGSDLKFVFSPDAEHCQLLCTQHPSCLFFSFVKPGITKVERPFHCYLKSSSSGGPSAQAELVGVTSGYSLKPCEPQPDTFLPELYHETDFLGADYQSLFTADYESCQRACTQDPACQFFTFVNELFALEKKRLKCWLKFSWPVPIPPVVKATAGVVSGFSHALKTTNHNYPACATKLFPDTDIPGSDFQTVPAVSADHCLSLCSAHPRCTYFSYASFRCYLKSNDVDMVSSPKKGFTSGIPARHCQLDNSWQLASFEGVDFTGSDIRYLLLNDKETCQRTCTEYHNCQFYSYVGDEFHQSDHRLRCYLKRVITMPAPPKVNILANAVSGFSLRNYLTTPH
ncbi:plasma kallikrein-like [Lampris incognitus]|uniref:plasma kallikrein-like n=1 Tax=Lampris incognitus TaxID=2546036 RepID=UPI0024B51A77|nr:plasma kallikrein-like [Lampris incognitus]